MGRKTSQTSKSKSFVVKDEDFRTPQRSFRGRHCVAVARKTEGVAVRDTKDLNKSTLFFTRKEWEVFVGAVKNGEFDVVA